MRPFILPLIGLGLLAVALWTIHNELVEWRISEITAAVSRLGWWAIAAAALAAAGGYGILSLYDVLALRYLDRDVPIRRAALAGFVGYAFSHAIGLSLVTGSAVRYRLYSAWGLQANDIAGIFGFNSATLWVGIVAVLSLAGITSHRELSTLLGASPGTILTLGVGLAVVLALYVAAGRMLPGKVRIGRWSIAWPSPGLAAIQVLMAVVDWLLAAFCLWVLLPAEVAVSLPAFAGLFAVASVAGIVSNVPAGLGVFEAAVLVALPDGAHDPGVAAALIGYRIVYYLLPMLVAAAVLAVQQALDAPRRISSRLLPLVRWASLVVPNLLSVLVFIGGVVLLASGAAPAAADRMAWLAEVAPLLLVELSHFTGSLVGLGLLLLALGLRRRLDAAWWATVALLALGIAASLAKGWDWEEAIYLGTVLAVLLPCHGAFYRRSALLGQRFTPGWLIAVAASVLATTWLGFFSYRHVEYDHDLWWQFVFAADAPRFLRATAGVVVLSAAVALLQLLRFARPSVREVGDAGDQQRALALLEAAERPASAAWLVALGDKSILFSASGRSFLMYGIHGRSWVAMGEPVGLRGERLELLWRFRELCDGWGGRVVFYEISPEIMPDLIELGLSFLKIGEQAFVDLPAFATEGGQRSGLRYTLRKARKNGSSFEIIPAAQVGPLLDRLQAISTEWMQGKRAKEKGFSLGRFDRDYIARFPVAVVRREGSIVAFANLWTTADRNELSVDLMRYAADAPRDVMEHLFIELMLWGRDQGYARFDLGMAPLAGVEARKLAPLWSRAAALIYRFGENYYNFDGLRKYKEKFRPSWEPRYIALPGGIAVASVLADVTFLIAGGVGGVVGRRSAGHLPLGTAAAEG